MAQDVAGAAYDQTFGFSWSPASQLLTRTASNAAYKWATPTPGTTANAYDGLNRDSAIVTAGGYDARGNLTADGSRTLTYDVENRMLTAVSGGTTVTFAYDPIGRLTTTAVPTSTTFLYDSDRLSAEYDAGGAVLRRYVHGPGVDEPLVWYEGAATTDRRWLHQDRQGSVIAWSNGSGAVSASSIYKYGPWGEPGDAWGAGSRFRYTGQIAIPEARLYSYKARMYDPATGRFMQTDPIGYKDDLDLYAYVGGDPVNRTDPTGQYTCVGGSSQNCDRLERDLALLKAASKSDKITADQRKVLTGILKHFGEYGKSGPRVSFGPTESGAPGRTVGQDITIDYSQIDLKFSGGKLDTQYGGTTGSEIEGAAVVVHEGDHAYRNANPGYPNTRWGYIDSERSAFRSQSYFYNGLGHTDTPYPTNVGDANALGLEHGDTECWNSSISGRSDACVY